MANSLHQAGIDFARARIEAGSYDVETSWEWTNEDGNKILGEEEDWELYGKHHLGIDEEASEETKDRYAYPFAKIISEESVVFRSGLIAIRSRSAAEEETDIYDAAGELIEMIDNAEGEEEDEGEEEGNQGDSSEESRGKETSTDRLTRSISFDRSEEVNIEDREIPLVWSTGARVHRWNFEVGEFIEELSLDPAHVRLDRLQNGAPLLEQHFAYELDSVLGKITEAEIKDGEGRGRAKFRSTEKALSILRDISEGTLGKLSVGYIVHKFEKAGEENDIPILRAVDWEPFEVSVVAVGADDMAEVRSQVNFARSCEVIGLAKREEKDENDSSHGKNEETENRNIPTEEGNMDETIKQERKRIKEIRKLAEDFEISNEKTDKMIEEGTTLEAARESVLKQLSEEKKISSQKIEVGEDNSREHRNKGMANALASRYSQNVTIDEHGRDFQKMGIMDMAREIVQPGAYMTPNEIAGRALSTDDFANVLLDAANVSLMDAYKAVGKTFEPFVRETTVNNFKNINRIKLSDAPGLEKVLEHEELKYGEMSDEKETYNVESYGRKILITRKTIIDDDFNEIMRRIQAFGRSANTLDHDLVYAVLTGNETMGDGNDLFDNSNHLNDITDGGAPSVEEIGKMIKKQKLQKSLNGQYINIPLGVVIVPVAHEHAARQALFGQINATAAGDVNPYIGNFALASDPRLDASSTDIWYACAAKSVADFIELSRLAGQEGPMVMMENKGQSGVSVEAVYDVAVKALDWRVAVRNDGTAA